MNCPKCQSTSVRRKRRSVFQKLIYFNRKRFKCFECKTVFLAK